MNQFVLPLLRRPLHLFFVVFFAVNFGFITYIVDLEQLVIADPYHFIYPLWPPPPLVDLVHFWGHHFDPLQDARPVWWKATIWIDALFFGPFYAFAIYAFVKGQEWIRTPALLWSAVMMTNVTIIMSEELFGPLRTHSPVMVSLANAPWFLVPVAMIVHLSRRERIFLPPRAL